jgi:exodeoxyribonuclease X
MIVLDCETTGIDPATDAVVEVAAVPVRRALEGSAVSWELGPGASSLVAPGRRVPPAARAIHHLGDEELRVAPKLRLALGNVAEAVGLPGSAVEAVAAHNAVFDRGFIGSQVDSHCVRAFSAAPTWLCTWRLALHIWPEADSHSNQALRYGVRGVDVDFRAWAVRHHLDDAAPLMPHRALYDAGVTACLLRRMLASHTLEQLLALQEQPVLQRTCRFGKHRGTPWKDVPKDYLKWLLRADPPFDRDIIHTAQHHLLGP